MSRQDTLTAEIVEIVAEIAEKDPREVAPDAKLEDLGIDSLDGLRIVAAVEKRYSIVIEEAEIARIRTMPDIFEMVRRYRSEVG
jgi:acyl carrier protein